LIAEQDPGTVVTQVSVARSEFTKTPFLKEETMPKLIYQVDRGKHIVVLWRPDGGSRKITDFGMEGGYTNFRTIESPTIMAMRANWFTVLAHGKPDNLVGLNDQESLGLVHNLVSAFGSGRNIVLLSCLTGQRLAQRVAAMNNKTVVASIGYSKIWPDGSVKCGVPYENGQWPAHETPAPLDWIKVQPDGSSERAGKAILEPAFLR
jgi:hypothetical protein